MSVEVEEIYYDNDGMDCYSRFSNFMDEADATVVSVTLTATGVQEVGKSDHYISLINTANYRTKF
jgi:predicted ribonuclease toxin of YeeF-YezG toxin-antitoxin module